MDYDDGLTSNVKDAAETEMENLTACIHAATSSLELGEVLRRITSYALAVLPLADCGLFQLYDDQLDCLCSKGSVGMTASIAQFAPKEGEGITGKVYQDGQPRIFHSHADIYSSMTNMTPENYAHLHAALDSRLVKAMISVPVSVEGTRLGVMTVYQLHKEGTVTSRHMKLLQTFAAQAGVAIRNARLHEEVKLRLQEVTALSEQLKAQNTYLAKRNEIHERLTRLSLQDRGLAPILNELQQLVEPRLSFVDMLELKHYPDTHAPLLIGVEEITWLFGRRTTPLEAKVWDNAQGEKSLYLHPILGHGTLLGCLVLQTATAPERLERIALEQSDAVLALELVKRMSVAEIFYKKTYDYFNQLLYQKESAPLLAQGRALGLHWEKPLRVIAVEVSAYGDLQSLNVAIHRIASRIRRSPLGQSGLLFGFHDKIILTANLEDESQGDACERTLASLIAPYEGFNGIRLKAGLGTAGTGAAHVARSHEEALQALAYMEKSGHSKVMRYERIGVNRLFLNRHPEEVARFTEQLLMPLRTHRHSEELLRTLRIYVMTNQSAQQSAVELHVHINTLYQRIGRIEEMLGLDFNRFEDYLQVQLAVHLTEAFGRGFDFNRELDDYKEHN
ncbi:helix-turn-helix domain-containing protein [Paenibacillus sp. 1P07SE]|uniref:helix-turn-helix domain-containing protein n=1 Tax=Paenibacillus sp. 1P07SE TaxID=3132209 RepID=UPI0039A55F62